jgi:hypothetical protein
MIWESKQNLAGTSASFSHEVAIKMQAQVCGLYLKVQLGKDLLSSLSGCC